MTFNPPRVLACDLCWSPAFCSSSSGLSSLVPRTFSSSSPHSVAGTSLRDQPLKPYWRLQHPSMHTSTAITLTTITKHLTNKNKKEVNEPMGFYKTDPPAKLLTPHMKMRHNHIKPASISFLCPFTDVVNVSLPLERLTSELSTGF